MSRLSLITKSFGADWGAIITSCLDVYKRQTEASADVFGGDKDYLVAVPSPGDLLAPEYQTTVELSADELKAAAQGKWPDLVLEGEPQSWIHDPQCCLLYTSRCV